MTQTSREEQIRASLLPQVIGIYFEVLEAFGAMAAVAADAIGSYLYMSHHGNCREHDVGQEARMFESCAVALGRMGVGLGVQLLAVKRLQNLEIPAARISLAKALRGAKVGTWPSGVRGKGIKLLRRLSADRDLRVAVEAGLALSEANYNVSRRLLDRAITDPNAMAHESNTHGVRGATELVVKAAASLRPAQVMKVVGLLDVQNPGYGNAAKVLEAVPVEMLKSHIDGLIERFEQPEQNYLRRRGSLSKLMAREGIGSEIVTNDARWARILALLEVDVLAYETWEFLQAVGSVILHRLDWLLEQDRHPRRWGHDRVVVMIGHATPAVTSPAVAVLVERTRLFNDREVRKAACKALGGLASCTAEMFEALMAAAKGDPHHEVRVQALYALKGFVSELSGEQRDRLAELYAGLFEDETCSVRIQAPRLYQAFGAPARPVLLTQARRLREAGARDLMHADHHLLQETEMALVGLELAE